MAAHYPEHTPVSPAQCTTSESVTSLDTLVVAPCSSPLKADTPCTSALTVLQPASHAHAATHHAHVPNHAPTHVHTPTHAHAPMHAHVAVTPDPAYTTLPPITHYSGKSPFSSSCLHPRPPPARRPQLHVPPSWDTLVPLSVLSYYNQQSSFLIIRPVFIYLSLYHCYRHLRPPPPPIMSIPKGTSTWSFDMIDMTKCCFYQTSQFNLISFFDINNRILYSPLPHCDVCCSVVDNLLSEIWTLTPNEATRSSL